MKPDDFEQRLARTPRPGPPAKWREEILTAARAARVDPAGDRGFARAGEVDGKRRPEPAGEWGSVWKWAIGWGRRAVAGGSPWGLLAACWVAVLTLNQAGSWIERRGAPTVVAASRASASAIRDPSSALRAARTYRAEVLALAVLDEPGAEARTEPEAGATPKAVGSEPAGRPRTDWVPGRKGTAGGAARELA